MFGQITKTIAHRPWPLPSGPWVMAQSWHDLLFAHWPIPVELMRALVPPQLELDTFDGMAWIGVVPFRMSNVRPRLMPALPWLSAFPELNVRTYVRSKDINEPKPGVWFFSLEAANPVAVVLARTFFKLPYFHAQMSLIDTNLSSTDETIHYHSHRTHRGEPAADFAGSYGPTGHVYQAADGTLEKWLTERYCLYAVSRQGTVYRSEIHHLPWPLQPAVANIELNTMAIASGITLPDTEPLLHFARKLDVVVWPLHPVK